MDELEEYLAEAMEDPAFRASYLRASWVAAKDWRWWLYRAWFTRSPLWLLYQMRKNRHDR